MSWEERTEGAKGDSRLGNWLLFLRTLSPKRKTGRARCAHQDQVSRILRHTSDFRHEKKGAYYGHLAHNPPYCSSVADYCASERTENRRILARVGQMSVSLHRTLALPQ